MSCNRKFIGFLNVKSLCLYVVADLLSLINFVVFVFELFLLICAVLVVVVVVVVAVLILLCCCCFVAVAVVVGGVVL